MSNQTIAFVCGIGLIIVSILGGGIEAKEVRLPQLGIGSRILAAIFGALLLAGAGGLLDRYIKPVAITKPLPPADATVTARTTTSASVPISTPSSNPQPAPLEQLKASPTASPVSRSTLPVKKGTDVTVVNYLGRDQIYEKIAVIVNGHKVGTLSVNQNESFDAIKVRVKPGDRYTLSGTLGMNEGGELVTYPESGSGVFSSPAGGTYRVKGDIKADGTVEIHLQR